MWLGGWFFVSIKSVRSGVVDLILHTIVFAFDDHGFGMVQKTIEDGGSDGAVVVEDFRPVFEDPIGREEDGPAFIAMADDLEEEIRAGLIEGQIAEFIDQQQIGFEVLFHFELESTGGRQAAARVLIISTAVANSTLCPFKQAA